MAFGICATLRVYLFVCLVEIMIFESARSNMHSSPTRVTKINNFNLSCKFQTKTIKRSKNFHSNWICFYLQWITTMQNSLVNRLTWRSNDLKPKTTDCLCDFYHRFHSSVVFHRETDVFEAHWKWKKTEIVFEFYTRLLETNDNQMHTATNR